MEDLGDPPTTALWLAWATAALLIIGLVSAGVMNIVDGDSGDGLVTAAGQTEPTLDPVTTTTAPPAPPSTGRQATASSTTVPKAAAAVLKALGTTVPPTVRPPATTSTTAPPVTTTTPSTTTSTTLPRATVTVANELPRDFVITLNKGEPFTVAANRTSGAAQLSLAGGDDTIEGDAVGEPPCEVGAIGDLFQPGGRYRVTILASQDACARLTVTPLV